MKCLEDTATINIRVKKTGGIKTFLVDKDSPALERKWHMSGVYPATYIDGKRVRLHRFIIDAPRGMVVDHINMDITDNRRSNLRICTIAENTRNRNVRKDSASGYKGVYYRKDHKSYIAYIVHNRKRVVLGERKQKLDAINLYNKAAKELFGEFARLNNEFMG